jgi:6-pyruvoyltetrahydropterin/6-carboxytetrahydropterin synthase
MKMELRQHFQVESARFLPRLPKTHPCSQMHGHSFRISLTLQGEVDPHIGWLMDYHEITKVMQPILQEIDHRVLNDVPGLENPSSENLCYWLFQKIKNNLPLLTRVSVSETPQTECSYPCDV